MTEAAVSTSQPTAVTFSTPRETRVLIAASHTGGHIIPALHIARAIKERNPGVRIEFIGAGRPLEEKLIGGEGYVRHVVTASGVKNRGVVGLVKFILGVPSAYSQLKRLYRSFRPDVVVGVGGYASVLPVIVAKFNRIPSWTHEAERHPGLANKVLAFFADRMSLAFSDTEVGGRVQTEVTGHPVRPELKNIDRHTLRPDAPKRLLLIGGSLGARGLDQAVPEITSILKQREIEVVHQCREESMEKVLDAYREGGIKAHVVTFVDDMQGALDWADIVISRAGASSVAEIACVNRPAIFVPYPHQQGTHQTDNARTLVDRGKALLVEEAKPQFGKRLHDALMVVTDRERFKLMKEAPFESKALEAAQAIARGVLSLVKR